MLPKCHLLYLNIYHLTICLKIRCYSTHSRYSGLKLRIMKMCCHFPFLPRRTHWQHYQASTYREKYERVPSRSRGNVKGFTVSESVGWSSTLAPLYTMQYLQNSLYPSNGVVFNHLQPPSYLLPYGFSPSVREIRLQAVDDGTARCGALEGEKK